MSLFDAEWEAALYRTELKVDLLGGHLTLREELERVDARNPAGLGRSPEYLDLETRLKAWELLEAVKHLLEIARRRGNGNNV